MSEAIKDVYRAINEVQTEICKLGISKDQKNKQQGYSFRGIDDVYNALAPIISKAKLCILPRVLERNVTERTTKSGTALFYVDVRTAFDFVSAKDGSNHTVITYGEAMDSGDKATNKAMSAAYKYACLQTFCIPLEGMPDADAETPPEVKPKTAPEVKPKTVKLDPDFLTKMGSAKDYVGEKTYYEELKIWGYEKANQIDSPEHKQVILANLKHIAKNMKKKKGAE